MGTLVAIKLEVVFQPFGQLPHAVVALQVDIFVRERCILGVSPISTVGR